jgi:chromosome segregation ATPase
MASLIDQIRFVVTGLAAKVKDQADKIAELTAALAAENADDQALQDAAAQAQAERDSLQAQLQTVSAQLESVSSAFAQDQAEDARTETEITEFLAPFAQLLTPPVEEPPAEPEPPAELPPNPPAEQEPPAEDPAEPA